MAVLEHAVHELVRQDHTARYGCLNSPAAKAGYWTRDRDILPDGRWIDKLVWVPNRFSKTCRFDLSHVDPKCEGCLSVGMGKFYDDEIRRSGT